MEYTDRELLEGLKSESDKFLTEIYKLNYPVAERMVLKNSGTKEDAKDVFQDAFIVLYKNIRKSDFKLTCSIKTYLYSVSWRMWMSRLNENRKQMQLLDEVQIEEIEYELPIAESDSQLQQVIDLLRNVGKNCFEILQRYYFHKQDFEEIASELGYASGQVVREQKYRCIKRVRDRMPLRD